jgi:hypothetical protein
MTEFSQASNFVFASVIASFAIPGALIGSVSPNRLCYSMHWVGSNFLDQSTVPVS